MAYYLATGKAAELMRRVEQFTPSAPKRRADPAFTASLHKKAKRDGMTDDQAKAEVDWWTND